MAQAKTAEIRRNLPNDTIPLNTANKRCSVVCANATYHLPVCLSSQKKSTESLKAFVFRLEKHLSGTQTLAGLVNRMCSIYSDVDEWGHGRDYQVLTFAQFPKSVTQWHSGRRTSGSSDVLRMSRDLFKLILMTKNRAPNEDGFHWFVDIMGPCYIWQICFEMLSFIERYSLFNRL